MEKWQLSHYGKSIEKVECVRETEKCVWIKSPHFKDEYRCLKHSEYISFHDTWKEAHTVALQIAEEELASAQLKLSYKQSAYE